jgi:hypothetical protein
MNSMLRRTVACCVLLIVLFAGALAQGLHWKSTTTAMGKELHTEQFLMPKMIKTLSDGGEAMVVRLDKQMIYEIKPEAKEYSEMTFEEFDKVLQKMTAKNNAMQEKMKNMPEAQRKMMEQMMGGQNAPATTKNTGEQKKIAGYNCTKHVISQGDKEVMTVWATQDIKEFAGMKKDYEEFAKRFMGNSPGFMGAFKELMKLQGFAMETQMGTAMTQTVTVMEKKSTPVSEYTVPAGYKKVKSKWQEQLGGGDEKE